MNLTNPTLLTTMAIIAVFVGGVVRVLKTKKMSDLLDALPFTKSIPKDLLPWLAVLLGVIITTLDGKLNGHIATWQQALEVALAGIFAGGTAVAGHETVAKALGKKKDGAPPVDPSELKTDPPPPPSSLSRRALCLVIAA